jgi:hypothetical protein
LSRRRKMRKMSFLGTAIALVLTLSVIVPVFGTSPTTVGDHSFNEHHRTSVLAKNTTLTITGSGTAIKIGNRTLTESASISLTATVIRSSPGRGMLNFTGGTLTIGTETYTVVGGHGIINYHSHIMVLHIIVKNGAGNSFHLDLYGRHAKTSSTTAFTVDFLMHQSKLAHMWFLRFPGATVTPK